jgi:hypothetical protein
MTERCDDNAWRRMVRHMRTVCPPPKGCRLNVRRIKAAEMEGSAGTCAKDGRTFTICIRFESTEEETQETLVHEWAHMMAWRPYHPLCGDHGPDWGVWYSVAYRAFHGLT